MAKLIRYTLAAIFLTTSIASLALWAWTTTHQTQRLRARYVTKSMTSTFQAIGGIAYASFGKGRPLRQTSTNSWNVEAKTLHGLDDDFYVAYIRSYGVFHVSSRSLHFPLWYAALLFALAAFAAICVRRFTIRSLFIATTIVAALLAMAVAL